MKEFETINGNELMEMSFPKTKAGIRKGKAAYKKMLCEICPSAKVRREAKRIAARNDSCDKCVFCDGISASCHYPHSDFYIEDLKIDPCYEGVLRYLSGEAEEEQPSEMEVENFLLSESNSIMTEMLETLKNSVDITYDYMAVVGILSGWIIKIADEGWIMPPSEIEAVRRLLEMTNEALTRAADEGEE